MIRISRRALLAAAPAMALPRAALAQPGGFPTRSITWIVPFAAGGITDTSARTLAQHMTGTLGQNVIIENRPGAGGTIGAEFVARSAPDGYTLLVTSSAFTVNPSLYKQVPYDPFKDFAPVAELDTSPNVFVATLTSGITSIKDVVARAKATPDELSYASAGVGTTPHLATELLKITAGINVTHVPYQGNGPAMQSILAGTVPLMCGSLPGAHGSIKNGQLRALAVTGPTRWYDMPDVPAMIELGYADFIVDTFHCMLAPAGTPREIVERLAAACVATLKEPTVHEKLRSMGFETIANGPDGLARRIAGDVQRYRDIIAKAGIERV